MFFVVLLVSKFVLYFFNKGERLFLKVSFFLYMILYYRILFVFLFKVLVWMEILIR